MNELSTSKTRLYKIFQGMKDRCYNVNSSHYKTYGAKGIEICPEWLENGGVQNFISWSLDNGYDDNLSLDRIDNNKGYSPDNCQWVTPSFNSSKGNTNITRPIGKPSLKDDLKATIIKSGWTMTSVVEEINKRNGTDYTVQNFSSKLSRGTLRYVEVEQVLEIIGYRIEWVQN